MSLKFAVECLGVCLTTFLRLGVYCGGRLEAKV